MNNRIIKFRGLHGKNVESYVESYWVYGLPYDDAPKSTPYYYTHSQRIAWVGKDGARECNAPIRNGTLCQYTGLKDKDGKEIYEWDIVKTSNSEIASVEKDNFQVTCFRNKGQIAVTDIIEVVSNGLVSSDGCITSIEVIGNVFQNPELLN